jgi:hypothetical protein
MDIKHFVGIDISKSTARPLDLCNVIIPIRSSLW